MMHNIVAVFASNINAEYPVVNGSIFNEEYNETLDSATIVLSQITKENRLSYIKPYEYVRVYDKNSWDEDEQAYGFDKIYLVDNFNEQENNIKEHIFGYTINLMSETKILEKIQCPNLTVTHAVNNGVSTQKTILQKIREYMELFVPKMKYSSDGVNWSYQPVIKFDGLTETSEVITESDVSQNEDERAFSPVLTGYEASIYYYITDTSINMNDVRIIDWEIIDIDGYGTNPLDVTNKTFIINRTDRRIEFYIFCDREPQNVYFYISFTYSYIERHSIINSHWQKFNVPCADMPFNVPTLRQLLTTLMQQVGCIPVVRNRKLDFLDFQLDAVDFAIDNDYTLGNTVNYIRRGLSSDSYVNSLVNISEQVLDSGNKVICEALGFRDLEKAILKQQENLFLETKFPIYKVEGFKINAYVDSNITINSPGAIRSVGISTTTVQWSAEITKTDNKVKLNFRMSYTHSITPFITGIDIRGQLYCFAYNDTANPQIEQINERYFTDDFTVGTDGVFEFNLSNTSYDTFYFVGYVGIFDPDVIIQGHAYDVFVSNFAGSKQLLTLYSQDITQLLVEKSIRQNLSVNFSAMVDETMPNLSGVTLSTLAKYVYGTIEYSIGSTKISGFSDSYNYGHQTALGWINTGYTYIENIWNFITTRYTSSIENVVRKNYANIPTIKDTVYNYDPSYGKEEVVQTGSTINMVINSIKPYNPMKNNLAPYPIFTSDINFSFLWFDISYQPLNSFNLSYVKKDEDIDFALEQFDGNVSGLTDFDRLSIHEQEQVDRIGNETLTINQRAIDFDDIRTFSNGPLYFKDDTNRDGSINGSDKGIKYIIFKRSFTIKNNFFNVTYIGSKDAILKNYFTSIRTKYRAYQYVDYNQSVLRKEKDIFYVKLSENGWYDGDDHIYFGGLESSYDFALQQRYLTKLLGSWVPAYTDHVSQDYSTVNSVKNCVLASDDEQTKNEVSVIAHKNFFAIIYEEKDNVGSGTYIDSDAFDQAADNVDALLGGVPQTWQIWDDNYNDGHIVSYVSNLKISNIFNSYMDASSATTTEIMSDFNKLLKLPILDNVFANVINNSQNNVVFSIVNDKTNVLHYAEKRMKTFYKDYSERINHTAQFIYYTDSENILWTENFFKLNDVSGVFGFASINLVSLEGASFELSDSDYTETITPITTEYGDIITFNNGSLDDSNPYICINWSRIPGITQFKVVARKTVGGLFNCDVIAFKKGTSDIQKFYITLNDTKSDYVMGERNGILYRAYRVANSSDSQFSSSARKVKPL